VKMLYPITRMPIKTIPMTEFLSIKKF